ncbi:retrovirus-related pol polyprotein from transposon TNT 1-94 [Tanacetum coccineum]
MYLDLKKNYWWPGMKRDYVKCVEKCLTCLKVKAEHQKPYGKVQPLEILVWKWEKITMDFVTKLPRTTKKHDAIWVIVDRLTKSAHFIPIRENMPVHKLAKIYVNKIVARYGVPVSICLVDESSVITLDDIKIDPELTSREEPETILGRKSRQLRNKVIPLVKVQWKHRKGTSIRWEPEEKMRTNLCSGTDTEEGPWLELQFSLVDNSKLNVNKFKGDNNPNCISTTLPIPQHRPKCRYVIEVGNLPLVTTGKRAKSTWDDLIMYHKGPFDVKESRFIDLKLCYNTFKFKEGESLTQTFTRYKALMNELVNDGIKLSKLEINTGFINGLPKKWLSFCQSLKNTNRVKDSELASLFGKLKYEENLIDNIYETEKNKSLISTTPLSTTFFSTFIVQDFQDSPDDEEDTRSSHEYLNDLEEEYQASALLAK